MILAVCKVFTRVAQVVSSVVDVRRLAVAAAARRAGRSVLACQSLVGRHVALHGEHAFVAVLRVVALLAGGHLQVQVVRIAQLVHLVQLQVRVLSVQRVQEAVVFEVRQTARPDEVHWLLVLVHRLAVVLLQLSALRQIQLVLHCRVPVDPFAEVRRVAGVQVIEAIRGEIIIKIIIIQIIVLVLMRQLMAIISGVMVVHVMIVEV